MQLLSFNFFRIYITKSATKFCNFVHIAIHKNPQLDHYEKKCLYSDAAGMKNRKYLIVFFLSLTTKKYEMEI